jgi:hypothetical protein
VFILFIFLENLADMGSNDVAAGEGRLPRPSKCGTGRRLFFLLVDTLSGDAVNEVK